jgi:CRISPR type II-A-associated protein Csn2
MIKITKYEIENQIVLAPEFILTLQIENPAHLYKNASELFNQCNGESGGFHLLRNDAPLNFETDAEMLTDPVSFEINNKRFVNLLHKKFFDFFKSAENLPALCGIEHEMTELFDKFQMQSGININYAAALDYSYLLKGFGVKLQDGAASLLEKLVCYINFAAQLKPVSVFIIMFAKEFLCEDEIRALHEHCRYQQISLMFIEGANPDPPKAYEHKLIIDKDLCEILA